MLRYKTKLDLVKSPSTTSGQETKQVYSYDPRARTGPMNLEKVNNKLQSCDIVTVVLQKKNSINN